MITTPAGSRVTERSEGKSRSDLIRVDGVVSASRNEAALQQGSSEWRNGVRFLVSERRKALLRGQELGEQLCLCWRCFGRRPSHEVPCPACGYMHHGLGPRS